MIFFNFYHFFSANLFLFLQFSKKNNLRSRNLSGRARDRVSESFRHNFHAICPFVVAFLADLLDQFFDPSSQILLVFDFRKPVKNAAVDHA